MFIRTLAVMALFISNASHAQGFDVQIAALKNPDAAQIELPTDVGELRSTFGADGLTRFLVGPFVSRADADQARDRLRAAGFSGSFVRANQDAGFAVDRRDVASSNPPSSAAIADSGSSVSQRDLETLQSLSDEERRDLVYLDGKLHRKVGDDFIPLRD